MAMCIRGEEPALQVYKKSGRRARGDVVDMIRRKAIRMITQLA
jgi:hypothetical protein